MNFQFLRIGLMSLSTATLVLFCQAALAQPTANLDHDIVDENNVAFDMNDLVADKPLVLLVSSGT